MRVERRAVSPLAAVLGALCMFVVSVLAIPTQRVVEPEFSPEQLSCGISKMGLGPRRRIISGSSVNNGDYPWLVYLSTGCTGSLISPIHVLSAAHCAFTNEITKDFSEKAGTSTLMKNIVATLGVNRNMGANFTVVKTVLHIQYDYSDFKSPDIGIFTLNRPVDERLGRSLCLPSVYDEYYGEVAMIVGWGAENDTNSSNNRTKTMNTPIVAKEAMIPINPPDDCMMALGRGPTSEIFDRKGFICAGGTMRGTEAGDSGGPLMTNIHGRWYQIGITSFGDIRRIWSNCVYDVGAYVRITEHCAWIEKMTNRKARCVDPRRMPVPQRGGRSLVPIHRKQ